MEFRTPQKPSYHGKRSEETGSTGLNKESYKKQQLPEETPVAYSWHSIDYRQSKYIGKVLLTQTSSTRSNNSRIKIQEIPAFNRIASQTYQQYNQYRHGPGILVLDEGVWVLGKWHYDQLIGKAIIITNDFSILEVIFDKENVQRNDREPIQFNRKIQQVCYVGDRSRNYLGTDKFMVVGSVEQEGVWKWVVDLCYSTNKQPKININKDSKNMHYYLKTQCKSSKNDQQLHFLQQIATEQPNIAKQKGLQYFGSYNFLIKSIKQILFEPANLGSQLKQSFTINQLQCYTPQLQNVIKTKIYNNENININESFYIQLTTTLNNQAEDIRVKMTSAGKSTYSANQGNNDFIEVQAVGFISKKFQGLGDAEWETRYRVQGVQWQKNTLQKVIVEQVFGNYQKYRYTVTNCSTASMPNQQKLSQKQKQQQHLTSLNFVNKSCNSIGREVKKLVQTIQQVYKKSVTLQEANLKTHDTSFSINAGRGSNLMHNQQRQEWGQLQGKNINQGQRSENIGKEVSLEEIKKQIERIHLQSLGKKYKQNKRKYSPEARLIKTYQDHHLRRIQKGKISSIDVDRIQQKKTSKSQRYHNLSRLYQSLAQLNYGKDTQQSQDEMRQDDINMKRRHQQSIVIQQDEQQIRLTPQFPNPQPQPQPQAKIRTETKGENPQLQNLLSEYKKISEQLSLQPKTSKNNQFSFTAYKSDKVYETAHQHNRAENNLNRTLGYSAYQCVYEDEEPAGKFRKMYQEVVDLKIQKFNLMFNNKKSGVNQASVNKTHVTKKANQGKKYGKV